MESGPEELCYLPQNNSCMESLTQNHFPKVGINVPLILNQTGDIAERKRKFTTVNLKHFNFIYSLILMSKYVTCGSVD